MYNIESLVLAKKGRNKKATLVKTVPIKIEKGQKGLAQKKIKKEVENKVSLYNQHCSLFNTNLLLVATKNSI